MSLSSQVGIEPGLWRWGFKKTLIGDIEFPETRMGEDQIFLLRVQPFQNPIYTTNKFVYKYCINEPNQLTSSKMAIKDLENSLALFPKFDGHQLSPASEEFACIILLKMTATHLIRTGFSMTLLWSFPSVFIRRIVRFRLITILKSVQVLFYYR